MDTTNFSGTNMNAKTKKKVDVRSMTAAAMLSAIGFILMYLDTATPFAPEFLKMDVSDLPALLGSFALGPMWGVAISLIKNLMHLPVLIQVWLASYLILFYVQLMFYQLD